MRRDSDPRAATLARRRAQFWFAPFMMFGIAMVFMHTQLVVMNLTTNEQINMQRYECVVAARLVCRLSSATAFVAVAKRPACARRRRRGGTHKHTET